MGGAIDGIMRLIGKSGDWEVIVARRSVLMWIMMDGWIWSFMRSCTLMLGPVVIRVKCSLISVIWRSVFDVRVLRCSDWCGRMCSCSGTEVI